jgi:Tfp pilus assembly PilM family ATPase
VADDEIQMAAVAHRGHRVRLLDVARSEIPAELESPEAQTDYLAAVIADYASRHGLKAAATLCLTGRETAFRSFLMPVMKSGDLASAVSFEARRQIPFPLDESIFDFRRTARVDDGRQARYEVTVQAATVAAVKKQMAPFAKMRRPVWRILLSHEAVGRLLHRLPGFSEKNNYTLVRVGRRNSEVAFYRGAGLQFLHTGSASTEMLTDEPDDARWSFFAMSLIDDIGVAYDYYTGHSSRGFSEEILLYGELSDSARLCRLLETKGTFSFAPFPVEKLGLAAFGHRLEPEAILACLPVAAGAATQARLPNLLPPTLKAQRQRRREHNRGRLVLALAAGLMLTVTGLQHLKEEAARSNVSALQQQETAFEESAAYRAFRQLSVSLASDRSYIDQVREQPSHLSFNLKELSRLVPEAMYLERLEFTPEDPGRNFVLEGVVREAGIPPELVLADFVEAMKASQFYHEVAVTRHVKRTLEGATVLEFVIDARGVV